MGHKGAESRSEFDPIVRFRLLTPQSASDVRRVQGPEGDTHLVADHRARFRPTSFLIWAGSAIDQLLLVLANVSRIFLDFLREVLGAFCYCRVGGLAGFLQAIPFAYNGFVCEGALLE
jgi:hypothetical protein